VPPLEIKDLFGPEGPKLVKINQQPAEVGLVKLKYIPSITVFMKDIITIREERDLWIDFIHKAKKEKKKAWDVLSPFLKKYLSSDEDSRVLLILFPKDLVDQVLTEEDPDEFIQGVIRKRLSKTR
jgi:hypothetical protein